MIETGLKGLLESIKAQRIKIYKVIDIDLSVARLDFEYLEVGTYMYVLALTGSASIRYNEFTEDLVDLVKYRSLKIPFYRFYITNTLQIGAACKLAIGIQSEFFELADMGVFVVGGVITEANSPSLYNALCSTPGTEYSQALGECRKFLIKPRGGQLKVCFTSGQSGTNYILLNDGVSYSEDFIHPSALTLYFQSPTASVMAEIVKWI